VRRTKSSNATTQQNISSHFFPVKSTLEKAKAKRRRTATNIRMMMMMKLQAALLALLCAMMMFGTTVGASSSHLRALAGGDHVHDKSPICMKVPETKGSYQQHMVKPERVVHFTDSGAAVAGRCGPENCEHLCMVVEKAVTFMTRGSGEHCECLFE
jgi:hypothetical protein